MRPGDCETGTGWKPCGGLPIARIEVPLFGEYVGSPLSVCMAKNI
jgi:hypothetical protein